MPYTIKDLERDLVQQLSQPTKLELISQFTPEQVLSQFTAEQLLSTMSPKEIQAYLRRLASKKSVTLPRKGKSKRKKD